jgi:hypothetical protein
MRLKFDTLLKVQDYYGSSDFQVEARYDKFDGEEYIMLRFGYWAEIDLVKLEEIFNPLGYKVEVSEFEDDECGWLYSYNIKNITL